VDGGGGGGGFGRFYCALETGGITSVQDGQLYPARVQPDSTSQNAQSDMLSRTRLVCYERHGK
jgi:hypothetical protein